MAANRRELVSPIALVILGGLLPLATSLFPTDSTMASWLIAAQFAIGLVLLVHPCVALPRPVLVALVAAAATFGAAALASASPGLALLGRYPRYEGLVTVAGYGLALLAGARLLDAGNHVNRRLFTSAVAVAALVSAGVGTVQFVVDPAARVIGLLGNSSVLGSWAGLALVLLGWQVLQDVRWLWVLGFVAAGWVLVLSASRGAWLGTAIALLAVAAIRPRSARRPPWWVPLGLVAVLAVVALAFPGGQARIVGATPFAATTINGRLLLWSDTAGLLSGRSLLGVGPSGFVDAIGRFHTTDWAAVIGPYAPPDSPHNMVLQILVATGAIGLIVAIGLAGTIGLALWRARPWDAWQAAAITAAISALSAWQFTFTDPVTMTVLLLIVGGAIATPSAAMPPAARTLGRALVGVWLVMALFLAGSALMAEGRLSSALTAGSPDTDAVIAAAETRPWDPDLAVRAGRALNQWAERGVAPADPAVQLLTRACGLLPGSTECLQALGDAQTLAGDPEVAGLTLERALAAEPVNVDTILKLGIASAEAGNARAAESWFQRASELRPTAAEPWQDLAALYRRLGREAEAARAEATAERLLHR